MSDLALAAARSMPSAYAVMMDARWRPFRHTKAIARVFMRVASGQCKRAMIFAPPRHGKSEFVSKLGPAWLMGNNPAVKIIAASHTQSLAEDFGGQVRNLIADPLHMRAFGPKAALTSDTAAKGFFRLVGGGQYYAVGIGGTPIGRGADIAIIDDPISSLVEASSPTQRNAIYSWYQTSILSRLENDGAVILMHQRWHEDDLAGRILKEEPGQWEVLNLPALAQENDILGRKVGEALWPERFDEAYLDRLSKSMGPRAFASMYQQTPIANEGGEFKRGQIKIYTTEDKTPKYWNAMTRLILVDAANSKKKNSDFTAMAVIGLGADGNYYLLDAVRDRLSLVERTSRLFNLHKKWQPHFVGYEQYGAMADIEHIQSAMETQNYRFSITRIGGQLAKEDRIRRMLPDLETSKWWFPASLHAQTSTGSKDIINELIETEMLPFPVGRHDDLIDAISRVYDMPRQFPRQSRILTSEQPSSW
jgi:predicted phage terminase large subunit-like protein